MASAGWHVQSSKIQSTIIEEYHASGAVDSTRGVCYSLVLVCSKAISRIWNALPAAGSRARIG